ncbi:MAG: glycine--tRNA ligase [Candidatus Woesearchaeota archaeon]
MNKKELTKAREDLMSFISEKGFVHGPSPEIYDGGVSGFYDFGPLGKTLKNNIENTIRKFFQKLSFYEVECPIVTPKKVWEASGHLGNFSDPLVECIKCKNIFRADNLIEETHEVDGDAFTEKDLEKFFQENEIKCPTCGTRLPAKIDKHMLMLKTQVGLNQEMYNRPETATTTYLPFLNYLRFYRDKLPFGIFQIGNAYRNEISPRQHLLRTREFTQAEAQLFIFKDQKQNFEQFKEYEEKELNLLTANMQKENKEAETTKLKDAMTKKLLKNKAYAWTLGFTQTLFEELGIPKENIRFKQHLPEKMSFYAEDAWDLEVKFKSYGWIELCGCHDRTDYDLSVHSKHSGKELQALNPDTNKKETPHILEIATGPNRVLLALLDLAYNKQEIALGKTKLKIPKNMAPVKAAILPLIKKEPLQKIAHKIKNELLQEGIIVQYDESASIGKRYLRQDSIGTPYCITIDFEAIEDGKNKDTVTIRERDSEEQKRIKIEDVLDFIIKNIK